MISRALVQGCTIWDPPPLVKIGIGKNWLFMKMVIGIGMLFLREEKINIGIVMLFTLQNRYWLESFQGGWV